MILCVQWARHTEAAGDVRAGEGFDEKRSCSTARVSRTDDEQLSTISAFTNLRTQTLQAAARLNADGFLERRVDVSATTGEDKSFQ